MAHVETVAGSRVIHIMPAIVSHQAIIGGIVDASKGEHRAQMITLCGVIVDDVKNDFDARLVQRFHHLFEFLNLLAVFSGSEYVVRREETVEL